MNENERICSMFVELGTPKGQLISKGPFSVFKISQKTICGNTDLKLITAKELFNFIIVFQNLKCL